MRVHFWGTRGSIPVALSGAGVRQKIKRALCKANGRHFESETAIERFIEAELDFPTRDGYGGNSACVDITGGADYMVCDMGSGLRCLYPREHHSHSRMSQAGSPGGGIPTATIGALFPSALGAIGITYYVCPSGT